MAELHGDIKGDLKDVKWQVEAFTEGKDKHISELEYTLDKMLNTVSSGTITILLLQGDPFLIGYIERWRQEKTPQEKGKLGGGAGRCREGAF